MSLLFLSFIVPVVAWNQFSLSPALCNPMDCSMPGLPVHHQFPEFTQTLLSRWCHPAISPSIVPFSSHLKSSPASGSFPRSQFFTSGGQSIGVSASASVLPMNIQDWFPLGWTGWNIAWNVPLVSLIFLKRSLVFPKYWSFSISPYNEYSGLISFRSDWLDLLAVHGTLESSPTPQSKAPILCCSAFFMVRLTEVWPHTGRVFQFHTCRVWWVWARAYSCVSTTVRTELFHHPESPFMPLYSPSSPPVPLATKIILPFGEFHMELYMWFCFWLISLSMMLLHPCPDLSQQLVPFDCWMRLHSVLGCWAALTKCHRFGGSGSRCVLSPSSGGSKSEVRVLIGFFWAAVLGL